MFGFGLPTLIVVLLGGGIAGRFLARQGEKSRASGATLVLRTFAVNRQSPDGVFVNIKGRASGISGWLLTLIGFQPVSNLQLAADQMHFKSVSLSGEEHQVVPLSKISSTHCGYAKPFGYLISGAVLIVMSLLLSQNSVALLLLMWVIGGILLARYWQQKTLVISLETNGGTWLGLSFKRSVMENVSVDIQQALKAVNVINERVANARRDVKQSPNPAPDDRAPSEEKASSFAESSPSSPAEASSSDAAAPPPSR